MSLVPVSDRPFIRRTAEPSLEIGPRTLEEMQAAYKARQQRITSAGLQLIADRRAEIAKAKEAAERAELEAQRKAAAEKEAQEKAAEEARERLAISGLGSPKIATIKRVVAAHFGMTVLDIVSKRRLAEVVLPRQIAMYLAKHITPFSLPLIGKNIGDRDHTTVLHGVRKIERLIEADPVLAATIQMLREDLELELAQSVHPCACGAHSAEPPTPDNGSGSEAKS